MYCVAEAALILHSLLHVQHPGARSFRLTLKGALPFASVGGRLKQTGLCAGTYPISVIKTFIGSDVHMKSICLAVIWGSAVSETGGPERRLRNVQLKRLLCAMRHTHQQQRRRRPRRFLKSSIFFHSVSSYTHLLAFSTFKNDAGPPLFHFFLHDSIITFPFLFKPKMRYCR